MVFVGFVSGEKYNSPRTKSAIDFANAIKQAKRHANDARWNEVSFRA